MNVKAQKLNDVHVRLSCDDSGVLEEISVFFTFEVPGAKYMPAYKNGQWDGKVRLFNRRTSCIYVGLLQAVKEFCASRGYTLDLASDTQSSSLLNRDTVSLEWIDLLDIYAAGQKIKPKDYQIEAVKHALETRRAVLVSPTGSGKSLIIYLLARWTLENLEKKILVIVPTISLVTQMKSDFLDYSQNSGLTDKDIHSITGGAEKTSDSRVWVSTWQSIYKLDRKFFSQFDMVIVDEAHGAKSAALTSIMDKCVNVAYRFGTTGTLDNTQVNPLILTGVFGPVKKVASTADLIARKELADIAISVVRIKYPDEIRKIVSKIEYHEEIDYIVTHEKRNNFIAELALSQKKNTLVLFNFVEKHGIPLYELIKSKATSGRKVFLICGKVEAEEREEIRQITETEQDAIIVASAGTMAVGVNVRNLYNIIFSSPSKSQIRVLQSIGRGLRKHGENKVMKLYDIVDDFSWKSKKNFGFQHGVARMKIYASEGFPMKTAEIEL